MNALNLNDAAVALAVGKFRQGNLDGAQQMFLQILDNDANNPDALYFMALIDHQSGRSEVAEYRARDLLRIKSRDGKAMNLLGTILMSQGKLEEASDVFSDAISLNDGNPSLYVNAAICQIGLGNPEQSIAWCKNALQLNPDYLNAYNILGNAWLGKGEYEQAERAFRDALAKQPGFTEARYNLGKALLEGGKPDEALQHFNAVLEQAPENVHALTSSADVLAIGQDYASAEGLYQQALSLNPGHAPAHTGLGRLYRHQGKLNEALSSFKQAIELNPNDLDALMFTGETFRKLGNHEAAAAAFRDVLTVDPDNAQAKFHLATVENSGTPASPDPEYVRRLFDEFAPTYDESLRKIDYNGPEQLLALAKKHLPEDAGNLDILDLGCGTGLSGLQFTELARRLKGIDISQRMVEAARGTGVYDELEVDELLNALVRHQNDTDLAVAADAFPYIGDLEAVFLSVYSALRPGGLFLFSVETHDEEDDYKLSSTARYSHSDHYVRSLANRRQLDVLACERAVYRKESGKPVDGLVVALRKTP